MTADLPRALLRPDRDGNAFEQTVGRLAEAIKLGVFAPGDRLPAERELAELMQVSRMTLREALGALREAGFVETRRGRAGGTYVTSDGQSQTMAASSGAAAVLRRSGRLLDDALDFRLVVEPGAAELAASRALEDVERRRLLDALHAVERAPDDGRRRIADAQLHLAIAQAAGSESVTAAVADAQVRLGELLGSIPVLRRNIDHSNDQHRAIVAAIIEGDPPAARACMTEHCEGTAALLRGLLG
ncbi:MAG: FCD domain-containing protein [Actinomycetes bacterium]